MRQAWTFPLVAALALWAAAAHAQTGGQAQTSPPGITSPSPNESVTVTGKGAQKSQNEGSDSVVDGFFGGLTGQDLARTVDALDRPLVYKIFVAGLEGPLGHWNEWHALRGEGRFQPTRDFMDRGLACRDFTAQVLLNQPEERTIMGTACREVDGWRFR